MMRKITLACSVMAMFAVASCSEPFKEPEKTPFEVGDPTEITINATAAAQATRLGIADDVIKAQWASGDQIGVFVKFKDKWEGAVPYTVVDSSISEDLSIADFSGPTKWEGAALPHFFYAYAPKIQDDEVVDRETGEVSKVDADPTKIPISLPSAQTQKGAGSEFVSKNMFMIAEYEQVTAPRSFLDPDEDQPVDLKMTAAFSIIEFRFASWDKPKVRINKLTLTSTKSPLAVKNGTVDITKAYFDSEFGFVAAADADFSKEIVLSITDPLEVPTSEWKNVIKGNKSREAADLNVVFPARFVVLPNQNRGETGIEGEAWKLKIEYTLDGDPLSEDRVVTVRELKPGERHSIPIVIDTKRGSVAPEPPEEPGDAWDGLLVEPTIDTENKIIEITKPGHLAWVANQINTQSPVPDDKNVKHIFDDYTLDIKNNINLGNMEWIPIGYDSSRPMRCHVKGNGHLISGLKMKPETKYWTDSSSKEHLSMGLFGYIPTYVLEGGLQTKTHYIKDLRVNGDITLSKEMSDSYGLARVGGIVGSAGGVSIVNCSFEGTMNVTFKGSDAVGGIAGNSNKEIIECTSKVTMTLNSSLKTSSAYSMAGGIVGNAIAGAVKGCGAWGKINGIGHWMVGGLIGETKTSVKGCRSSVEIFIEGNDDAVGGLIGVARGGAIMSCYSTESVTVSDGASAQGSLASIGGLIGVVTSSSGTVSGCYARGKVNASREVLRYAGCFAGYYQKGLLDSKFDFTKIKNNYFLHAPMYSDEQDAMELTSVMRFSSSQWPQNSTPGWGIGDGSGDNKYWNVTFPDAYGVEEWDYPMLYWEEPE